MKLAWKCLIFGLCVNLAVTVVVETLGVSPALTEGSKDMKDPSDIVGAWNIGGTGSFIGDIFSGLHYFWSINVPFIEGVLQLMTNMNCPLVLVDPIRLIWRFIWVTFVVEFISGRPIMYD